MWLVFSKSMWKFYCAKSHSEREQIRTLKGGGFQLAVQ